jgi:hypothetical protein
MDRHSKRTGQGKNCTNWYAERYDLVFQTRYAQFKSELKAHQSAAEQAHKQAVDNFSPAAKEADAKLTAIANNPTLNAQQKNQQISSLVSGLPSHVRQEIENAMQG